MAKPTRYPKGISTAVVGSLMGDFPLPDPFHTSSTAGKQVYVYANDYVDLGNAASRTITGTSSTFALADGIGGWALVTPGGTTTTTTVARTAAAHQFVSGSKFWYVIRLKTSAVGAGVITRFGLQNGSGANTTNDAIYFTKPTAAGAGISLVSTVATVATTLASNVISSTTADTFVDVGFYYDGKDLLVYANDALVARVESPTIGASGTTLSNTLMQPFVQITPTATDTMTVDYVMAAQEVSR